MSVKRRPESDLNHDNWADEEEPEEVGEFQKADEAELKTRVIARAKRRVRGSDGADGTEGSRPNIFTGFSAFAPSTKPTFNFADFSAKTAQAPTGLPASAAQFSFTAKPTTIVPTSGENMRSAQFCTKLTELNKSVVNCVNGHIKSGKLCILTPIFNDYMNYVKELEENEKRQPAADTSKSTPMSTFTFANTNNVTSKPLTSVGSTPFSSGSATFSFGSSTSTAAPAVGFFSNVKPAESKPVTASTTADNNADNGEADAEDEPPKVEFTPVVESESLYSKRCKVFVKVDKEFKNRGTGTLYLKSVPDTEKVQLIVRADTNLGNILLNTLLAEGLPVQKNKNNVMIVCIPTPSDDKPTTCLIRVKSEDDCDEVLAEIKKYSK